MLQPHWKCQLPLEAPAPSQVELVAYLSAELPGLCEQSLQGHLICLSAPTRAPEYELLQAGPWGLCLWIPSRWKALAKYRVNGGVKSVFIGTGTTGSHGAETWRWARECFSADAVL